MPRNQAFLVTSIALAATLALLNSKGWTQSQLRTQKNLPKTVEYVDLNRYKGVWYQQSLIPYFFQRGCSKTKAEYSLNPDGSIKVFNSCIRNGALSETIGKATPQDSTNSKLVVQFSETFNAKGQYWIVRLGKDEDYGYAVVSNPDYSNLWILSRVPIMKQQLYNEIVQDLRSDGYPVEKLVKIQQ